MGLWGAAQAIAFGLGGFMGTMASDLAQWLLADSRLAYAWVFAIQALLFVVSAWMAIRVPAPASENATSHEDENIAMRTQNANHNDRRLDAQRERLEHAPIG